MAVPSPSKLFADSLAEFSKSAYRSFAALEAQSQTEVIRVSETAREAKVQRDKALKDFHAIQLESQELKQEHTACKASLSQAEVTIQHHQDLIVQLRRDLKKAEDQARNWQEHFLRVEQDRCALSSKMEEVLERFQWNKQSLTKITAIPSPNQPPAYNYVTVTNSLEAESSESPRVYAPHTTVKSGKPPKPKHSLPELPPYPDDESSQSESLTRAKRPTALPHTSQRRPEVQSTVIRRVKAVINVKQEVSEDEVELMHESDVEIPQNRRRKSRRIITDEDSEWSPSDVLEKRAGTGADVEYNAQLLDEDEEDELMMGSEMYEGVGDTRPREIIASHLRSDVTTPPRKKRRVATKKSSSRRV